MGRPLRIIVPALLFVLLSAQSPGEKAPEFVLRDINGKLVAFSSFKGGVVVINFWALWCPPCREEIPALDRLYKKYGGRGLSVLAVSVDSAEDLREFLKKNPVDYTVLAGGFEVSKKYNVYAIPSSFIIDGRGIIIEKFPGWVDWSSPEIAKKIEDALKL